MTCAKGCDHNLEDCLCGCEECQMEQSGICWSDVCDESCGLDHQERDDEE